MLLIIILFNTHYSKSLPGRVFMLTQAGHGTMQFLYQVSSTALFYMRWATAKLYSVVSWLEDPFLDVRGFVSFNRWVVGSLRRAALPSQPRSKGQGELNQCPFEVEPFSF